MFVCVLFYLLCLLVLVLFLLTYLYWLFDCVCLLGCLLVIAGCLCYIVCLDGTCFAWCFWFVIYVFWVVCFVYLWLVPVSVCWLGLVFAYNGLLVCLLIVL